MTTFQPMCRVALCLLAGVLAAASAARAEPVHIRVVSFNIANFGASSINEYDRSIVHLVNSLCDEIILPISEVPESRALELQVDMTETPSNVFYPGGKVDLSWHTRDGTLTVTLPSVHYDAVIVIDH